MSNNSPLTPEERERLGWCLSILEEETIADCRDEAEEIACREFLRIGGVLCLLPLSKWHTRTHGSQ
jgi:hypothetical protein